MIRYIILLFFVSIAFAYGNNISLTNVLNIYRGTEYSVLLMPAETITSGKGKKTRAEVHKGFIRSISELSRQVTLRNIKLNLKVFNPDGSNLPQYLQQDAKTYYLLKSLLEKQVTLKDSIMEQAKSTTTKTGAAVAADTIGLDDLDGLDDSAFDISAQKASMSNISASDMFVDAYVQIAEQYNGTVLRLADAEHPFLVSGTPDMKTIQSIYGMAFFPQKVGSVHFIKIYLVIGIIKTETQGEIQVVVKETPLFRWDRNALYITGASGKILRQLISGALGESFLD